ncbi:MAG: GTPase RsgA [Firmicutes bacterium]|nr:GTPase RsgA [Bacillota bacterium]
MNNKCVGCGAILQTEFNDKEGYTKDTNNKLCERCFRINHYGDYKVIVKDNNEFINILKDINKTNDLVVLVVDLLNINQELLNLSKIITNPILLVLSKRDLLPKSLFEDKILEYMDRFKLNIIDKVIISSNKNYQFDDLYEKINLYKRSKDVYVVGFTNAGKSTMINKLLYNYSNVDTRITTSVLPSTTLNNIELSLNDDLTIIDTPGLLDKGNIINYVDGKDLKVIVPTKEIKPITYQIKGKQVVEIDKYAFVECLNTDITLFMSNKLNIKRNYNDFEFGEFDTYEIDVNRGEDIVIVGLGFIKVSKKSNFKIHVLKNVLVYKRDSLI